MSQADYWNGAALERRNNQRTIQEWQLHCQRLEQRIAELVAERDSASLWEAYFKTSRDLIAQERDHLAAELARLGSPVQPAQKSAYHRSLDAALARQGIKVTEGSGKVSLSRMRPDPCQP